jgi:hypothetical protein
LVRFQVDYFFSFSRNGVSIMKNKFIVGLLASLMAMSMLFTSVGAAGWSTGWYRSNAKYCKAGKAKDLIYKTTTTMTKGYSGYCWWYTNTLNNNSFFKITVKVSSPSQTYTEYGLTVMGYYYEMWWSLN